MHMKGVPLDEFIEISMSDPLHMTTVIAQTGVGIRSKTRPQFPGQF